MVVTYVIPVAAMGVSYSLMSHVLWRAKGIGELNQRQAESIQSKRKVSTFLSFHTLGGVQFKYYCCVDNCEYNLLQL